ncbi:MAG: SAM-dependent methyltransferase [Gammaproteobacteria bacterium]|nr:SAM-dependent methyltransferase [Gammaproteobacteria bacterium]
MPGFALLIAPSANKVYASSAIELTVAELRLFSREVQELDIRNVDKTTIGGLPYVVFDCTDIDSRKISFISNLSSAYALFERCEGALLPVELISGEKLDSDLITIQRYAGKTNEQFTRLMLNLALVCSDFRERAFTGGLHVFDPVFGRGTTLNRALTYGHHVGGTELDKRSFDGYQSFIKTWLKDKRFKHRLTAQPVKKNKKLIATRFDVTLARSRDALKAGEQQTINAVNVDTRRSLDFFAKDSHHVIVGDLPYGIRHGAGVRGELSRTPDVLVADCLPVWAKILKTGGTLALSWNTRNFARDKFVVLLRDAGLLVLDDGLDKAFKHRVDHVITRDLIVAKKV